MDSHWCVLRVLRVICGLPFTCKGVRREVWIVMDRLSGC